MIVVPAVSASEPVAHGVRLHLEVPTDLTYFEGHFPEVPLLPGVVQVAWAIEFGRQLLGVGGTFRALNAVKFMRVIQPPCTVVLLLQYEREKRQLDFAYEVEGRPCSSGSALFDA